MSRLKAWKSLIILLALALVLSLGIVAVPMAESVEADEEPTNVCWVDSATGNDTNSGNQTAPFATIQKGIDTVAEGGTVHVAAGTYNERITINKSLTVRSIEGAEMTTINAQGLEFGVLIHGMETVATFDGFMLENYSRVGILAGSFSLAEDDPAVVHILNNIVKEPITQQNNNCIQIGDGTTGTVIGNEVMGAFLESPDWTGSGILVAGSSDVLVSNNFVHDCESGIVIVGYAEYRDAPAENNLVENNRVENNGCGIAIQMNSIGTIIRYNDVLNNTDVGIESVGNASFEMTVPSGTEIHNNNIVDNVNYGVKSSVWQPGEAEQVDATNNWWGSAFGPTHDSNTYTVPSGGPQGDAVSANVDFVPWLDAVHPGGTSFAPVENADTNEQFSSIQAAIDDADTDAGDIINVAAGTYNEDVTINKSLTLVSAEGKDNTTINGQSTGEAGAVRIAADNVVLGGDGTGFTVNGAGVAAVYFTQPVSGCLVEGNGIVAANTKNALLFGGGQSSHTIRGNTFQGDASQLVYVNGQPSVGNASTSVNFINNTFSGTAPTGPALGQEAAASIISGNTFATVTAYASLELWVGNTVTGNNFTADLSPGGVYVLDNTGTDPYGIPGGGVFVLDIDAVLSNNTFLRAVVVEHPGSSRLPKIWANIQDAVNEAVSGDTINVAAGTYNEAVTIDKSLTLQGAGSATTTVTGAHTITANDVIVDGFTLDGGITLDDLANTIRGGTISNNIITGADNPDLPIKAENGIRVGFDHNGKGVDGITIENNTIINSLCKGIRFSNTKLDFNDPHDPQRISNITISGNEIKDNGSAGIETYGPGPNTIINNIISGNAGNGINLKFDDGDVVTGNTITNNTGPGITLRQVTDTVVENNSVSGHQSQEVIGTCDTVIGGKGSGIHIFDASENNTIRFNDITGNNYGIFIHSKGDLQPSGNSINFNNISGNDYYGMLNALVDPPAPVDAENNWWGKKGKGAIKKMVSGSVDYDPWIGAGVANAKSKNTRTGKATVNAKTEADTEVDKSGKGTPTVTVAKYEDNPGRGFSGDIGKYIDVHIDDDTGVDELMIKLYYTDAEIAGLDESSLRLRWWDGDSWELCSDSGVNMAANYMWAKVRTDTTPSLSQLTGTPFAGRGTSARVEVAEVGPEFIYLRVDFLGEISKMRLGDNNRLRDTLIALSPDGRLSLEIEEGTLALVDGKPIYLIEIREAEECPPLPEDTMVAGNVYDITPSGATFDEDIILILGFNPMELPENTLSVTMAYYVSDEGWVELESEPGGVAELGTMTAAVSHFTPFAILAKLAPPAPPPVPAPPPTLPAAHFVASGLTIEPSVRGIWEPITFVTRTGESVTITANVANDGGQEGTYIVELKINGETVDSKEVTLAAGQSQQVSFALPGMDYGRYEVEVAGLSGEFTASRIINWWLIIGIIAAIGLITWGVIRGRRRVYS